MASKRDTELLNTEKDDRLALVSSLYYEENKTQLEISKQFGISRSGVSRLLTEARKRGIVEIIIHHPLRTVDVLERELKKVFGLKEVRILAGEYRSEREMLRMLGRLAAVYFEELVNDGLRVGISWGSALHEMIKMLKPVSMPHIEVYQLIGATGAEDLPMSGPNLSQMLAGKLSARNYQIHAPLIVNSVKTKEVLLSEQNIKNNLVNAARSDIALVGIGSTREDLNSLIRTGYLSKEETQNIRDLGAVGDVCAQHYNLMGEYLDIDVNQRVIGIDLLSLKRIDIRVGVAGGSSKAQTIHGALRGGYVNVLISDEQAAKRVLALAEVHR